MLTEFLKDIENVPVNEIPAALSSLAAAQAMLAARLLTVADERRAECSDAGEEKLLSITEAAAKLQVSPDWLYHRSKKLPFVVRVGRVLRFSQAGLERWIRNRAGK